jgi:hypothetical protein
MSKYKDIDFNDKNSKNEVNSPYIVYLFFGELISTKGDPTDFYKIYKIY